MKKIALRENRTANALPLCMARLGRPRFSAHCGRRRRHHDDCLATRGPTRLSAHRWRFRSEGRTDRRTAVKYTNAQFYQHWINLWLATTVLSALIMHELCIVCMCIIMRLITVYYEFNHCLFIRNRLINIRRLIQRKQEAQLSLRDRATRLKSCKLLRCTNVDDLHLNSPETDEWPSRSFKVTGVCAIW